MAGSDSTAGRADQAVDQPSADAADLRRVISLAAPAVRRYLFGMSGNWHEAEDAAQESLLKAWHKRATFDGRADPKTWIFRIARNCWLDRLRRRRVRPAEVAEAAEGADCTACDPADAAAQAELVAAVEQALAVLPAEQREALALRESEGLTFSQIGELLDVPAATVKSRVRYALLKLADRLRAFAPESVE